MPPSFSAPDEKAFMGGTGADATTSLYLVILR